MDTIRQHHKRCYGAFTVRVIGLCGHYVDLLARKTSHLYTYRPTFIRSLLLTQQAPIGLLVQLYTLLIMSRTIVAIRGGCASIHSY